MAIKRTGSETIEGEITANEFTNVKDIKGEYLYTKDEYLIVFLRVFPFNLDLLSKAERQQKTAILSAAFDGDRKDFTYFTFPREIDLDDYKNFLKEEYQSELKDIGRRKILTIMIQEANELSTSGENFEHQHFVKLWKQIGSNLNDTRYELLARLEEFKQRYEMVGIQTEIIKDIEIIKLCNLFGNSQQASYEIVDDNTLYAAIPQL